MFTLVVVDSEVRRNSIEKLERRKTTAQKDKRFRIDVDNIVIRRLSIHIVKMIDTIKRRKNHIEITSVAGSSN